MDSRQITELLIYKEWPIRASRKTRISATNVLSAERLDVTRFATASL